MPLHEFSNLNKHGNIRSRIIYNPTTSFGINPKGLGGYIGVRCFKYKFTNIISPTLVILSNQKYLMPGWVKVHPKTELSDIEWIKPIIKKSIEKFENKSSSSNKIYITKRFTRGNKITYTCTCPGAWISRGNCKHIKQLK